MINLFLCLAALASVSLGAISATDTSSSSEEEDEPRLSLSIGDARQGNSTYLYLYAENLSNIAAFTCTVFYPNSALSIYYHSVNSSVIPSSYDFDIVQSEGKFVFSFLSGSKDGVTITGKTQLLSAAFSVSNSAEIGSYRVSCAVGEVYDTNKGSVSIASPYALFNVSEQETYTDTMSIYLNPSKSSSLEEGDEVSLAVRSYFWRSLSTFRLILTYDYTVFDFVSFSPSYTYQSQSNSVNSATSGVISWAMISMNGVYNNGELGTLTLKVKEDKATSSEVNATLSQVRLSDKTPVNGSSASTTLTTIVSLPKMSLTNLTNGSSTLSFDLVVEGKSAMASGDFSISYPTSLLSRKAVSTSLENNVFISPDRNDGTINFSYLNASGLSEDTTLLSITLTKLNPLSDLTCDITIALRYSDSLPKTAEHKKINFTFLSLHIASGSLIESFSLGESWYEGGESFASFEDVYMNEGDSILLILNGSAFDVDKIDAGPLSRDGSYFKATSSGVYSFAISNGKIAISSGSASEEVYTRRAKQFASKLRKQTEGITICGSNGFVSDKKDAMIALINEYEAFPDALRSILDLLPSADNALVMDTMVVLYRGNEAGLAHSAALVRTVGEAGFVSLAIASLVGVSAFAFFAFLNKKRKKRR